MQLFRLLLLSVTVYLVATTANASDCTDDCVAIGEWQISAGIGLGWRNNPLHLGDDSPMFVLPEISYYGERFFIENLDIGWTLFEDRTHQFNLLITPSAEQMFFNPWDPYNFFDPGQSAGPRTVTAASNPTNSVPIVYRESQTQNGASSSSAVSGGGQSSSVSTGDPVTAPPEITDSASEFDFGDVAELIVNDDVVITGGNTVSSDGQSGSASGDRVVISDQGTGLELSGLSEGDRVTTVSGSNEDGERNRTVYVVENGSLVVEQTQVEATPTNEVSPGSISVEEVADRRMAGMAGFEYFYSGDYFEFHTQALTDITNIHKGHELRLALIFPWEYQRNRWALTLGTNYKSQKLLNYYYGVHPEDTPAGVTLFEPSSAGFSKMVRLDWQKPLSRHWSLRGIVQYTWLPDPIYDSPLVSDNYYNMFFFGGVYHF